MQNLYILPRTVVVDLADMYVHVTAFNEIGGYNKLESVYLEAVPSKIIPNTTCHLPRPDAMHLFRDPVHGDLPWPGMTLGLTILATWYWCTDQVCLNTHLLSKIDNEPTLVLTQCKKPHIEDSIANVFCIMSCVLL